MKISVNKVNLEDQEVHEITLMNKHGMEFSFLTLGGIITKILVPDIEGNFENVVLSHADYEDYRTNKGYFGAIIGRTSGRIKNAQFELNGTKYSLAQNYGENHGHGGLWGFSGRIFQFECSTLDDNASVKLKYVSSHLEEGYPGEVLVEVVYSLNDQNEFGINYGAVPTADTLINLTNHTYFNLSGSFEESILYHELMIKSEKFAEIDDTSAPTGKLLEVDGTPFDFRYMREIGEEIKDGHPQLLIGNGYDHPFLLEREASPKVRLAHRFSGRVLEIESTAECVVVYTQNYTDNQRIKGGGVLENRRSVALEFQNLPIGKNEVNKVNSIIRCGERYSANTVYKFKVEQMNI